MSLLAELQRRNVIRMAGLYLVGAWLLVQVAGTVLPWFDVSASVLRGLVVVLAIGFVPALAFAWIFELTPQGLKRDEDVPAGQSIAPQTARRMNRLIVAGLSLVILLMVVERVWFAAPRGTPDAASMAAHSAAKPEPPPAATPTDNSIAVLAFRDLSQSQDQAFFSEGMAEEILNALTRVKSLRVLGRSSSFQYKGKDVPPQTIGQQLGVAHVLNGSVRKQGNKLRISAALIRTRDGVQQWSKQYDGDIADVFDLQDSCARDIAAELDSALAGGQARLVDKATDNPDAYAKFIEAQQLVTRRFGDSLPRAIVLLDDALKLDPGFSRAWAKLAVAHAVLVQYVGGDWNEHWALAEKAANRAIALDPRSSEAYATIGYINLSRRRYLDMDAPARRALELDPDDITSNFWLSNQYTSMGRLREAEQLVAHALQRDPANPLVMFYMGNLKWAQGDYQAGRMVSQAAVALDHPLAKMTLAYDLARRGEVAAGAKDFATAMTALGTHIPAADIETVFMAGTGNSAERARAVAILDRHLDDEYTPTFLLLAHQPERSFALFERNKSGLSDAYYDWVWQTEDWSREARQHPAFQGFAKRIGLVDYWKQNRWPDLCSPTPDKGPDAFQCQ
jgi:TolB-like protein/Tfp pilus assembly protein PilF